jgi:hypothetical protein
LEKYSGVRTQAQEIYCGNAWSVVRRISTQGKIGSRIRLWIVSAGIGLVTPQTTVPPYSATFARGEPDSVLRAGGQNDLAMWWNLLVGWRRFASVADIAKKHPNEPLITALSVDYLAALRGDLIKARERLKNPESLVIISAGADKNGELAENFLPCDSRLEHQFGRSRMALNARVLEAFLNEFLNAGKAIGYVRTYFEELLKRLPASKYPLRERGSDEQVRGFIRKRLSEDSQCSHTGLLRAYRDKGLACEQTRFRRLYRSVAREAMLKERRS